jgi:hypothetical protein
VIARLGALANVKQGDELLKSGRPAEAEAMFRQAIEADPNHILGWRKLAAALEAQKKDATEASARATQLTETHADPIAYPDGPVRSAAEVQAEAVAQAEAQRAAAAKPVSPPPKVEIKLDARPQPGRHIQEWIGVSAFGYGGGLRWTFYWFRPDGTFYSGSPNGATSQADFAALEKSDPGNCGTYGIAGEELTLQRNGGEPHKVKYNGTSLGDGVIRAVYYIAPGHKLDGTWTSGISVRAGNMNVTNSSDWVFRRDGTFNNGSVAAVGNRNGEAGKGNSNQGTYQFTGHQLVLKYDNGTTKSVDTFGTDNKDRPDFLGIDGSIYNLFGR